MYTDLDTDCERLLDPPESTNFDTAGELFRNIVSTTEGPLNPPILGDFKFLLPQNWGLGGLKKPSELTICPIVKLASSIQNWGLGGFKKPPLQRQYFQVLNSPAASELGDLGGRNNSNSDLYVHGSPESEGLCP